MNTLDTLLTAEETAEKLRKTPRDLANMRYSGTGPAFVKVGKTVRYRPADVNAWLDSLARTQTGRS